ncbi:MAG TPA: transcription antitermination factor NusB [Phnomibacter sp.]|nr:transcription antitermination factor NusB [Phnomibacter sp.]
MQSLYALHNSDIELLPGQAAKMLKKQFENTTALFTFLVYHLAETARYAETDARNRAGKHLPSQADLNVAVKIAGNTYLWRMLESEMYQGCTARYKPGLVADPEWIRKLYMSLTDSTLYSIYNDEEGREKKSEREILEFIFTDLMMANEDFTQYVEDQFNNWDDDADMLRLLILHFIQKPAAFKSNEMVSPEKEAFAIQLLETVVERQQQLDDLIKPKLRNWDPERLAQLDTILLQMGVCEFLYFETIPIKVTINEYIDLAKEYSTQQSGQFVNGILDNIRKELEQQDQIRKVAFTKKNS